MLGYKDARINNKHIEMSNLTRIEIGCNYHTKWQSHNAMRFVLKEIDGDRARLITRTTNKSFWTNVSDLIFIESKHNKTKAKIKYTNRQPASAAERKTILSVLDSIEYIEYLDINENKKFNYFTHHIFPKIKIKAKGIPTEHCYTDMAGETKFYPKANKILFCKECRWEEDGLDRFIQFISI